MTAEAFRERYGHDPLLWVCQRCHKPHRNLVELADHWERCDGPRFVTTAGR